MLLIPFIENSFKHGYLKNGVLDIFISLSSTKEFINFSIENTNSKKESSHNGIGLINIKKRLNLLYKDHYNLDIINSDSTFNVNLVLKLK